MDVTRINNMGWKYKTALREGIEKAYFWFKNNLELQNIK
jgi:nucleoside-diphosphate-sugar epimerase